MDFRVTGLSPEPFMHLYGLSDADSAHVLDSFPGVREHDLTAFGAFRTRDDVLAQLRAINGGVLQVAAQGAAPA